MSIGKPPEQRNKTEKKKQKEKTHLIICVPADSLISEAFSETDKTVSN